MVQKILIARVHEKLNHPHNAISAYRSVDITNEQTPRLAFIYGKLAHLYLISGQYEKAIQMAKMYLPFACAKFSTVTRILLAYSLRSDFRGGLDFISLLQTQANGWRLNRVQADYFRAYVFFLKREYPKTVLLLQNQLSRISQLSLQMELGGLTIPTLLLHAEATQRMGDASASRKILNQAIAIQPNAGLPHFLLAETCYKIGDTACLKEHLRISFEIQPTDPATTLLWAKSVLAKRQLQAASVAAKQDAVEELELKKKLQLLHLAHPREQNLTNRIATYLESFAWLHEAEELYIYARDTFDNFQANNHLASFYLRQQQFRKAELVYLQAMEKWPFEGKTYARLVSIYIEMREKEVAQKYLQLYNRYAVNLLDAKKLQEKIEEL